MDSVRKTKKWKDRNRDVLKVVERFKEVAKENPLYSLMDPECVKRTLMTLPLDNVCLWYDCEDNLVAILVYAVGQDWWSNEICVSEALTLLVDTKWAGIQREAIKELERVAHAYGARMITAGNALAPLDKKALVGNGYRRQGYNIHYDAFIKVLEGEQKDDN